MREERGKEGEREIREETIEIVKNRKGKIGDSVKEKGEEEKAQ